MLKTERDMHTRRIDEINDVLSELEPGFWGAKTKRIIEYVHEHPGCTARDVKHAMGTSAAANLATLAVRKRIARRKQHNVFVYFPVERS